MTAASAVAQQKGRRGTTDQAPAPVEMAPFVRGATEVYETFGDRSTVMTTSAVGVTDQEVPAFGFVRSLFMWVVASGSVKGGATVAYQADAPFSAVENIVFSDVNGKPLTGPISGYDLYLINKWGGYAYVSDPIESPLFQAGDANGDFTFGLRIPVEVNNRDGLGALPNQHSDSNYHVSYDVAASTKVYSTPPATTLPTLRVRFILESWSPPAPASPQGHPQMMEPPASGTTQHWTKQTPTVSAGERRIEFTRRGNLLRTLILVLRDSNGARTDLSNFPDSLRFQVDTNELAVIPRDYQRHLMNERNDFNYIHTITRAFATAIGTAGDVDAHTALLLRMGTFGLDDGVLVFDWSHDLDGKIGGEMRDQWLATTPATRLEISGEWGANAARLQVLTNDVAPNGNVYI